MLYKKYDFSLNLPSVENDIIKINNLDSVKKSQMLRDGDIVFTLTSETVEDLGHCTLIINPEETPFVSGMETTVLHLKKPEMVLPAYLNYIFQTERFRKTLRQYVTGMKVYRVHPNDLMKIEINLPSLDNQSKIVGILDLFSDSITNLVKINDNLEAQCQAEYDLLHNSAKTTILLCDLAEVCYGKDHSRLAGGSIPVYGSGGVMRYVESSLYDGKESVLIPRKGSLNNLFFISEPFWSVDTMFYTKMKKKNIAKYLYYYLKKQDLASMNSGSAVPSMTTDILNSIEIPIPSEEELIQFDNRLQPLFDMINHNKKENATLVELRNYLLPKLMSGEIDVSNLSLPAKYSFNSENQ